MVEIRKAQARDAEQIYGLMKELAIFEGYVDRFFITPEIVRVSGFEKTPPDFHALVCVEGERIVAVLVYYFLPYTAQNRPAIYMKELFVETASRGKGIGKQLMEALKEEAKKQGCAQIKWKVAPWNKEGQRFYERLGAKENTDWLYYEMDI